MVYIGNRGLPLISGEVHYWRLLPENWDAVLDCVKDLGLKIISSYIPWQYHEYERGKFDFSGTTSANRNLIKFINLAKEKKFWLIIRPGPFIYSEWVNFGVPDYAAKYHRLHPNFLKSAEVYLEKVVDVIKPYFASKGGNIILLQADNEIDPFCDWYSDQLGLGENPGLFQQFLKEKYIDIISLNAAWKTRYKSFDEVRAVTVLSDPADQTIRIRYLDFCDFRYWYVNKYAEWVVNKYKQLGVDIPIYLNAYPTPHIQNWAALKQIVSLVGIDTYPSNEFSVSENEHAQFIDMIRYLRTFAELPYIAEFGCGVWHGHHYHSGILTARHYKLLVHTALSAGIAGWNWYMITSRDNWYFSPITEWGRRRYDLYPEFKSLVSLYFKLNPPTLERLTDTAVTFNLTQFLTKGYDPVRKALYQADIDYEFFDLKAGAIKKPLLFYSGTSFLEHSCQEKLLEYLIEGGNLVFFSDYPKEDELGNLCNLLQIPSPDAVYRGGKDRLLEIKLGNQIISKIETPYFYHFQNELEVDEKITATLLPKLEIPEEEKLVVNRLAGSQFNIGYLKKIGKGNLLFLGLVPTSELVVAVHKFFNIPIYSRSNAANVLTYLLRNEKNELFLFVFNLGCEQKQVFVSLYLNGADVPTTTVSLRIDPKDSIVLPIPKKILRRVILPK